MKPLWHTVVLALCVALGMARPGAADGESLEKTLSPYFLIENGDPAIDRLPLAETKARVRIAGVIADVVVTQVYTNKGSRPINARYVFPASTRAAVHGMTLQVGDVRIRATIREKVRAKQEFEEAKKEGKSAALLEQERPNVFSMSVANVLPGDDIRVELHYSELLIPTDGTYEFVYPTVVGPRYSTKFESTAAADAQWVKNAYTHEGEAPKYAFGIETSLAAGMPIEELSSPSHRTHVDWQGMSAAKVDLDPGETNGGNRDFILRYRLQGQQVTTGLLLYPGTSPKPGQPAENFFLLMVQPPERVAVRQIPPREYVFVLDVSGSMMGFPLDTAKALMRELIGSLRPIDSFNVILFSGGSRLLAPKSLPATKENVERAIAEIDREQGGGGTELGAALDQALALPGAEGVSRSTVVVTDGYIAEEPQVFAKIRANLNRSNLFAFGIGSAVNRHLIEGMAHAGAGEPFVVDGSVMAKVVAASFREYIASPVLTDIAWKAERFEAYDVEPQSIPDLFADRPLVIFGKWRGRPEGTIRVTGVSGGGTFESAIEVATAKPSADLGALRYLWARSRVARLSDYGSDESPETVRQITALGLQYDLLTKFTSFLAVHEVVRNPNGQAQEVVQPLPLPQGVSDAAVGHSVPEPELVLLLGLALGLFGLTPAGRAAIGRALGGRFVD